MERIQLTNVSKRYSRLQGPKLLVYLGGRFSFWRDPWFWSLQGIDLTLQHGSALGIIGSNGSGKTTLLRIIAGVTVPTSGTMAIHGNVVSLLELFSGMQMELSGRENIGFNGIILGMRRREIKRKFDAIVDFAGIRDFLDMPLKHYSTGMMMRLSFSVAIHTSSDIILVDEAWSIGDADFQEKSFKRLENLRREGATLVLVSHDPSVLQRLTGTTLWLNKGRIEKFGETREVISSYLSSVSGDRKS
jgi:lipopolysaccharide transport system ATP-binding protein